MGVKDLWQLLAPIGRRVSIETLEGKTLAIDASIWITQFVKAMRDEDGKMLKNAHILGTLRRILKLLYHRIRPVFVFDGATPLLKIRTVQTRKRNQEKHELNKKNAAQRLFQSRLKQLLHQRHHETLPKEDHYEESNTHETSNTSIGQFAPSFRPLTKTSINDHHDHVSSEQQRKEDASVGTNKAVELNHAVNMLWNNSSSSAAKEDASSNRISQGTSSSSTAAVALNNDIDDDDDEDVKWVNGYEDIISKDLIDSDDDLYSDYGLDDEDYHDYEGNNNAVGSNGRLRSNRRRKRRRLHQQHAADLKWSLPDNFDEINSEVLSSLPSHIRKSLVEDARKKQRISSRSSYLPVAGNIEMYSQTQLANFLKTSKLNRKFEEAQRAADGEFDGKQIAAEGNKRYLMLPSNSMNTSSKSLPAPQIIDQIYAQPLIQNKQEVSIDISSNDSSVRLTDKQLDQTPAAIAREKDIVELLGEESDYSETPAAGGFFVEEDNNDEKDQHQLMPETELPPTAIDKNCATHKRQFGSSELDNDVLNDFRHELEVDRLFNVISSGGDVIIDQSTLSNVVSGKSDNVVEDKNDSTSGSHDNNYDSEENDDDVDWQSDEEDSLHAAVDDKKDLMEDCHGPESVNTSDQSNHITNTEKLKFKLYDDDNAVKGDHNPDRNMKLSAVGLSNSAAPAVNERNIINTSDGGGNSALTGPSSDVLERAVMTASNMADWAGRAVRNALKEQMKSQNKKPASIQYIEHRDKRDSNEANLGVSGIEKSTTNNDKTQESSLFRDTAEFDSQTGMKYTNASAETQSSDIVTSRSEPLSNEIAGESKVSFEDQQKLLTELDLEESYARRKLNAAKRDTEGLTEEMKDDIVRLLKAFNLPYIVAPYEAEAQCAVLEQLSLVEGVVTEDSDALLFGAKTVYKNIFSDRKYVEVYLAEDAKREMGLSRDALIALAYFLGSDYTDGINGIGIVNAVEIVQAFFETKSIEATSSTGDKSKSHEIVNCENGFRVESTPLDVSSEKKVPEQNIDASLGCLRRFKDWLRGYDFAAEMFPTINDDTDAKQTIANQKLMDFQQKHRTARARWTVPDSFPNPQVAKAYLHPAADTNPQTFRWSIPQRSFVREYCSRQLGWTESQMDSLIDPVLKRYSVKSNQRRIDSHFVSYHDNTRFAKIASDRLREAVVQITGKKITNLALTAPIRRQEKKKTQPETKRKRTSSRKTKTADDVAVVADDVAVQIDAVK